jgi:methionyl-tRNA formyltransferase
MSNPLKTLVFFGSGALAAKSLELAANNFGIETVITKPATQEGINNNPVIKVANEHNIKLLFSNNSKELDELFEQWQPDSSMGLVIDYGIIISQSVINKFDKGIINSHFSLLPQWRGADPITYALLSGQPHSGVSLMKINDKLDEGEILSQKKIRISSSDDNASLSTKLIIASNELINTDLASYLDSNSILATQASLPITYSRKINKSDGLINWHKPASVIEREIRAFSKWPCSYTAIGKINLIIHEVQVVNQTLKSGEIMVTANKEIYIGCKVESIQLLGVQPSGKTPMTAKDFINGYQDQIKTQLLL